MRLAQEADLAALVAVMSGTPWEKTEYLKRQVRSGNVVVAEDAGTVAGLIVWNREFFALPFIWLVAVLPAYRRHGIAGTLFAFVETACEGGRLYTSTNRSHLVMHNFLQRRGYQRAGEVDLDPGDPEVFYYLTRA
ncbi:MAG: GNAT family N-acetyltransferase [Candidatus Eremiobacteraeota bacterium]|nr:GNAT family N-acetyltransferase [Candidatus Eremiobacteraeota bacterium]